MPEEDRVAAILADWHERNERGEAQSPPEVIREHPDLAEVLVAHFAALEMFDRVAAAGGVPEGGPPRSLGEFRILREIGRGGMGVVYEAEQTPMGRKVALKVLYPAITTSTRAVRRFQREARAAGRVHHTNLVPVYGMGEEGGVWFYAMELVHGRPLAQVVEDLRRLRGRPPGERTPTGTPGTFGTATGSREHYEQVARMFAGVAEALEVAHQAGIVHRDLKPSNLILDADGALKVLDFGLARMQGEGPSVTAAGDLLGTPAYMSPEQAGGGGERLDARTDVYSLGATLYEVLTLRPPFRGKDLRETCARVLASDPASPRRYEARIPRDLETIVLKAMEKERERRYGTAGEMARDLRSFAEGASIRARRVGPLGRFARAVRRRKALSSTIAAAALLAAAVAVLAVREGRRAEAEREAAYDRLCAEADRAASRFVDVQDGGIFRTSRPYCEQAFEMLTRAIELRPQRMEAYAQRAFISVRPALEGFRPFEERSSDLEEARRRGLGERAFHLARALILHTNGKFAEGDAEEAIARGCPVGVAPLEAYLEGRTLQLQGRRPEAIERFTAVITGGAENRTLLARSLFARAMARAKERDVARALEDLAALQGVEGDPGPFIGVLLAALWRKVGRPDRAETQFQESLAKVRSMGTESAWRELLCACLECREVAWHDAASEEALGLYKNSVPLLLQRSWSFRRLKKPQESLRVLDEAARLAPGNDHVPMLRGQVLLEDLNQPGSAIEEFDKALALPPEDACEHYERAMALSKLGLGDEAMAAIQRAEDIGPNEHSVHHEKARILQRLGKFVDALPALDRAGALNPDCGEVPLDRVRVLREMGELARARDEIDRLIRDGGESRSALHEKALVLLEQKNFPEALIAIQRSLGLDPSFRNAHILHARILEKMGRKFDEQKVWEDALKQFPADAVVPYEQGGSFQRQGRLDLALKCYEEALALKGDFAEAHSDRGEVLLSQKNPKEALVSFTSAVGANARLWQAQAGRGKALHLLRRLPEAEEAFREAIRLRPDQASIYNGLGNVLCALSRPEEALKAFDKGISLDGNLSPLHFNRGNVLRGLFRFEEAIPSFDRAIAIDPRNGGAYFQRAAARTARGEDDEALKDLEKALEIPPRLAVAKRAMAGVLALLGRFDDAERALRSLRHWLGEDPSYWVALGEVLLDAGRREPALGIAEEALRKFPGDAGCAHLKVRCLRGLGRFDEARGAASAFVPGTSPPPGPAVLACLAAFAGDEERARTLLREEAEPKDADGAFARARAHAILGNARESVRWLWIAADRGMRRSPFAAPDPDFERLEADQDYRAVLERLRKGSAFPGIPGVPR